LRGENADPRRDLNVTAPVVFGRMHILPIVTKLLRAHLQLNVNLIWVDRVVRLVEEGIDVAVRIAVVRLVEVRRVLVASPTYLADRSARVRTAQTQPNCFRWHRYPHHPGALGSHQTRCNGPLHPRRHRQTASIESPLDLLTQPRKKPKVSRKALQPA
jgi:DNA-binding transcriptional LysR family regulator